MKKALITAAILMCIPLAAHADVVLSMNLGTLYKNNGSTPLPSDSVLALIADADHDGFGDLIHATNSYLGDSGDVMLGLFKSNDFLGGTGATSTTLTYSYAGLHVGDPLLLVWYDKPFGGGPIPTDPGVGTFFGTYRTDQIKDFSDIAWLNPADGATVNLNFETLNVGGSSAESLGRAQFQTLGTQVVPEPVSCVLSLIGGGAMLVRRRFMGINA